MYIKGSPVEIQTPKLQNPIGHSTTATPPVLSPSSILPSFSFYSTFIPAKEKFGAFKKCYYVRFFAFSKLRNFKIT
jgi:hypothetical protein